ncbi:MAG: hypothetical protein AAGI68_13605 [Planctomycetota bacterium]
MVQIHPNFPRYTEFDPKIPVWCVTPDLPRCIHRFFDTSPMSPSGRYVAVFQLPFEDRQPVPGEIGHVCVVDLETGEQNVVAETRGWETQLGANLNWGGSDHELYFNDVDTDSWTPFVWKLDPLTGEKQKMDGTVFHASPDGKLLISSNLTTIRRTQPGYGVVVPEDTAPHHIGPVEDDGFYLTDTTTGQRRLLVSTADLIHKAHPAIQIEHPERQEIYGNHCKFNAQGDRLMISVRYFETNGQPRWNMFKQDFKAVRYAWFTIKPDGSDLHCAVGPEQWIKGGHHAAFHPDGQHLTMNLKVDGEHMRFAWASADGSMLEELDPHATGSGHPTVHRDGRYVLTDCYTWEEFAFGDGTVPLRWLDLKTGREQDIVRIHSDQPCEDVALRVDPHPAWDRTGRYVTFNGYVDGTRRVFVADMQPLLDADD